MSEQPQTYIFYYTKKAKQNKFVKKTLIQINLIESR